MEDVAVLKGERGDLMDDLIGECGNPFSDEVMAEPFPDKFRMPSIPHYDGTGDPAYHLGKFISWMRLYGYHDNIQCRAFDATIAGND